MYSSASPVLRPCVSELRHAEFQLFAITWNAAADFVSFAVRRIGLCCVLCYSLILTHMLLTVHRCTTVLCCVHFMQAVNPAASQAGLLDVPAHTVVLDVQAPYSSSDDILTAAVKQQVRSRLTAQEYEASGV